MIIMPSLLLGVHMLDNVMKHSYCATNRKHQEALKGPFHLILPLGFTSQTLTPLAQASPNSKHK